MKQQRLHKILSHYIYILLCIIIITITSGCSTPFLSDNNSNNTKNNNAQTSTIDYALADNEAFNNYTNDLFCNSVTSDTVTLHSLLEHPKDYGIDDYEVTLGSIDLEELDSVNDITEALNELLTFDRSSLSQSQQITYDELKRYLETQLEYSDLYLFNTQLSTTIGIQVQLPLIFAEYSFEEEKDITEYITLMCDTDRFFQNIVDYETLRSKAGYFMQDELANEIITQCQTFVQSVDSGFLITTFDERLNSLNNISDEQKAEYKKQNLSAIQEHLVKGYNILIDGLNSLLGSNIYKGGLKNYPNGDKYFEYLLKYNLGWSKSVEELNALADKYLKKNLIAMQKLLVNEPTLSTAFESFSFGISNPAHIISDFKNKTTEEIFYSDFKIFHTDEFDFGVAQISAMSREELDKVAEKLRPFLKEVLGEKRIDMVYVMLTDILEESSKVIFEGHDAGKILADAFEREENENGILLEGIISRKKQLIPTLMNAMAEKVPSVLTAIKTS